MKIGEAAALDRQLWEDIAQIPDEYVQDRYLAMAEQLPAHQEAQAVLSGLSKVATEFGALINARQSQLSVDTSPSRSLDSPTELKVEHNLVPEKPETYPECEPLEEPEFTPSKDFALVATLEIGNLFIRFRQVKRNTELQTRGLGPKKAAKVHNREDKQIEDLFLASSEDGNNRFQHIARHPEAFSVITQTIINQFMDEKVPEHERELYRELGQKLLHSAEHYVADHADELTKDDGFMRELLFAYALDASSQPESRGAAAHLLRGYFSTANTPERAVERNKALVSALINSYKSRGVMDSKAIFDLLLYKTDFFARSPFIENLVAARVSFHKPELYFDAAHLTQFPAFFFIDNMSISRDQVMNGIDRLQTIRDLQIQAAKKRASDEGMRVDPDYLEKARMEAEDGERIDDALNGDPGRDIKDAFQYYLDIAGEPGREFTTLFLTPNELSQQYELTIGHANLQGDPLTETLVIDGDHAIDFVWPKNIPKDERDFLKAKALRSCILERQISDPERYSSPLEELVAAVDSGLDTANYRYQRASVGAFKDNGDLVRMHNTYIRKRVLYDDEHTSPLTDFDVKGFNTEKPIPEVSELVDQIARYKTRFVPKRGIEVVITDEQVKQSGLSKLVLRSVGANHLAVEAVIHDHNRLFQIKNNRFFDKHGLPIVPEATEQSIRFASYCMSALAEWMCRPKIVTDEGDVVEGSHDSPIKGGYYAYLRVRESDGYKYRREDKQWYLCAEEREEDLDEESKRLASLDETGKMRNSTYVRIHPDDGTHLAPLKVYL